MDNGQGYKVGWGGGRRRHSRRSYETLPLVFLKAIWISKAPMRESASVCDPLAEMTVGKRVTPTRAPRLASCIMTASARKNASAFLMYSPGLCRRVTLCAAQLWQCSIDTTRSSLSSLLYEAKDRGRLNSAMAASMAADLLLRSSLASRCRLTQSSVLRPVLAPGHSACVGRGGASASRGGEEAAANMAAPTAPGAAWAPVMMSTADLTFMLSFLRRSAASRSASLSRMRRPEDMSYVYQLAG